MNKYDFLRKLDKELSLLDQEERKELLGFYEERFYNGTIYENKTEEQVIAELESPEQIARNILLEYGITPREAKARKSYINTEKINSTLNNASSKVQNAFSQSEYSVSAVVVLIVVDLFILSWLIPTLFSVVVSLGGSLLSYISVFGLIVGSYSADEFMTFLFLTGIYYLLLLLTLAFLDLFIWVLKKAVLYHLRVFKYKKYGELNKRISKYSVEGWFKRHRFIRFVKNTAGVAAVVLVIFGGTYLFSNRDEIYNTYVTDKIVYQTDTIDPSLESYTEWELDVDVENVSVKIVETSGDEFVINRNYVEDEDEEYSVTQEGNTIVVFHDMKPQINFWVSLDDLAELFIKDEIIIELPEGIAVEDINIKTSNADVEINSIDTTVVFIETSNASIEINSVVADSMDLTSSNGSIRINDVVVDDLVKVRTTNAYVKVKYSTMDELDTVTSNGKITLNDVNSDKVNLETSNASVELDDVYAINSSSQLDINTSNGSVDLENVYLHTVVIKTSNAGIDYYNDDSSFEVDVTHSTTNGNFEGNVD